MASASDCLSESCGFESRQYCISGKITVVVYSPWTREVAGSNPASQTKQSNQVYLNLISYEAQQERHGQSCFSDKNVPLVKWLRRHTFYVELGVRFPYGIQILNVGMAKMANAPDLESGI